MAYEPTVWKSGDLVTATKLNKMEQGIAGSGSFVVHIDDGNATMDKTWNEIKNAMENGVPAYAPMTMADPDEYRLYLINRMLSSSDGEGTYFDIFVWSWIDEVSSVYQFRTRDADGYPQLVIG